jgi:hypothetical protein
MTADDYICLGFLEALEGGRPLPDGCDSSEMARQGLVSPLHGGGWAMTSLGRLRLQNLRSTLEFGV